MRVPAQLVIIEDEIILQPCGMYRGHECAVINEHHVCPKSWFEAAGVLVQTPMIQLCPTCHFNVHAAIDAVIKGQNARRIPRRARHLADEAFRLAEIHHLTPRLTL